MEGLRIIGDPNDLARRYYEQGADEIIFMDTVASLYGRNQIRSVVERAALDVFIPMTAGGGLRTLDDIYQTLRSGADKVAINTAAINRPEFLREAAEAFGSQCIVLAIEAKRLPDGNWECFTENGRERSYRNVIEWVVEAEKLGAGEIFITSVDQEGARRGFDLDLIEAAYNHVDIPIIAGGGAGSAEHVLELVSAPRTDAVCCGSLFHYDLCPLPDLKSKLFAAGHVVRQ